MVVALNYSYLGLDGIQSCVLRELRHGGTSFLWSRGCWTPCCLQKQHNSMGRLVWHPVFAHGVLGNKMAPNRKCRNSPDIPFFFNVTARVFANPDWKTMESLKCNQEKIAIFGNNVTKFVDFV